MWKYVRVNANRDDDASIHERASSSGYLELFLLHLKANSLLFLEHVLAAWNCLEASFHIKLLMGGVSSMFR